MILSQFTVHREVIARPNRLRRAVGKWKFDHTKKPSISFQHGVVASELDDRKKTDIESWNTQLI